MKKQEENTECHLWQTTIKYIFDNGLKNHSWEISKDMLADIESDRVPLEIEKMRDIFHMIGKNNNIFSFWNRYSN